MTDSLKLAEMQRTSIEFERQRHLANWFIKSSPHMATPPPPPPPLQQASSSSSSPSSTSQGTQLTSQHAVIATSGVSAPGLNSNGGIQSGCGTTSGNPAAVVHNTQHSSGAAQKHNGSTAINNSNSGNPVFFLMSSNGNTGAVNGSKHTSSNGDRTPAMGGSTGGNTGALGHLHVEGRKPKLRRFNSHDTSSNMFSVADFENARLARRNEIEMKQRLQRRMRMSANGGVGGGLGCAGANGSGYLSGCSINGAGGSLSGGGDYSTGDSKASKYSNESQHEPLPADVFLDRYSLPRVVRISYKTKFSDETLQSSSSNGSSTVTSHSSASAGTNGVSGGGGGGGVGDATGTDIGTTNSTSTGTGTATGTATSSSTASSNGGGGGTPNIVATKTHTSSSPSAAAAAAATNLVHHHSPHQHGSDGEHQHDQQQLGELFLLYRLIRQRHIYHGHNAKTAPTNRKKGVLIPQEFPGYFSLINDKGLPTATLYTSLIQLVRERVYKFISVDNMPAFTESQTNANQQPTTEGCLPLYTSPPPASNRPQYVKTTARGGQVFRLLAVFEDGKQDHNAIGGGMGTKANANHGREKEKGRYAQLLNENRQVLYVSLSTKGKFYEIEPGIPQILQKLGGMANEANKKVNPDCVHRITALITPNKELPLTLRFISGPNGCANAIPENLCITRITTENVVIACPIEDVEVQSPLHLRKLHLTKEMNLLKSSLGFENEQRMLANPNVQNILKFCQFNCDQFLKMVEIEILSRPERSGSKSRVDGLKILKPLNFPKLLRREKTTIPAHEKEDSIIFLTKSDLANLEAKESASPCSLDNPTNGPNRITDKMKVFQSTKKKWFRKQDKHSVNSLTSLELNVQSKRMSMERYSDMSKLLQERFGDKSMNPTNVVAQHEPESISEPSGASDVGCSDTETTTLATIDENRRNLKALGAPVGKLKASTAEPIIQKSLSLQDIELITGGSARKPDLLPTHLTSDTISEAGTDLEDLENREPDQQQSFITEKLYNEFHVKTRQYSKSSSSLHQLLNFSLPQKLQLHDNKRSLAQIKHNSSCSGSTGVCAAAGAASGGGGVNGIGSKFEKRLDFNIGEPVTGRRAAGGFSLLAGSQFMANSSTNSALNSQNTSLMSPLTPTGFIEDDLPYSSVRDSLVLSSDESASENPTGNICQALHLIDYAKENIYAEICHDANAVGGVPTSHTRDTFSAETHSTEISDDYGDYASLTYPTTMAHTSSYTSVTVATSSAPTVHHPQQNGFHTNHINNNNTSTTTTASSGGNGVSRVQINCSSSPISYHTVYFGDEPLGENHHMERRSRAARYREETVREASNQRQSHPHPHQSNSQRDRTHVTTVELEGGGGTNNTHGADLDGIENIYNTLK